MKKQMNETNDRDDIIKTIFSGFHCKLLSSEIYAKDENFINFLIWSICSKES